MEYKGIIYVGTSRNSETNTSHFLEENPQRNTY